MISKPVRYALLAAVVCAALLAVLLVILLPGKDIPKEIFSAYRPGEKYGPLQLKYPFDKTLFPPEIPAPTFRWCDGQGQTDRWVVGVGREGRNICHSPLREVPEWTPTDDQWRAVKAASMEKDVTVTILGTRHSELKRIVSAASITI
ncbi:MAG: hypothetical protein ACYTF6_10355, partial [Planctomycetota bacterium]